MTKETQLDNAWKQWKKDDKKAYNKFLMWSKRELNKQKDIDRLGYSMPVRKHEPGEPLGECSLYKTYETDHFCDICMVEHCRVRRSELKINAAR